MSTLHNTTVKSDETDKNKDLKENEKKQKNAELRKTLDDLRASKGFRELGDMLYLDD
tara:strand:+ start:943 stop:1113 length:171 start_codon:yes stop_codon:yes gene_type:complete